MALLGCSYTLTVKLLSARTFPVLVGPTDTVAALKQRIFEREGIPPTKQNLLVMGKQLQPDSRALAEYALAPGDTVYVTAGLRGPPLTAGEKEPQQKRQKEDRKDEKVALYGPRVGGLSLLLRLPSPMWTAPEPALSGTDVALARRKELQALGDVHTVLQIDEGAAVEKGFSKRWPAHSQVYCFYTRNASTPARAELTGVATFGLSNPHQSSFYYAIGVGLELLVEMPTAQVALADGSGLITVASVTQTVLFQVARELAHQVFALGLQIRELLEKCQFLSVELPGVEGLPADFVDPESGRCCVLLGHCDDPGLSRGFNVLVPQQSNYVMQSVWFVPSKLLPFAQCQQIRKSGAEARRLLVEQFRKDQSFSVTTLSSCSPSSSSSSASAPSSAPPSSSPSVSSAAPSSASSSSSAAPSSSSSSSLT